MSLVWFDSDNFMYLSTGLWILKARNPHPRAHNSVTDTLGIHRNSATWAQATDSFAGLELRRLALLLFPKLVLHGGECSTQERWCLQCERGTQLRCPGGCHSALSLEPHTSVSPHMSLACSTLPPPAPRGTACQWDLGYWPFKRVPQFLADSNLFLAYGHPSDFTASHYVGTSFWFWCFGLGTPAWGWDLAPQGNLCSWDMPLDSQLLPLGGRAGLFLSPPFLSVSMCCLL